jgi:peptidoglycan-associated lipoprotein
MIRWTRNISVIALCSAIVFAGCSKKTTTIETTPEPVVQAEPEPVPEPQPEEEVVFETVDMDAALRDIFTPIYFEYDKFTLSPEALEQLGQAASFLSEHEQVRFLLEGHADERGTDEYNFGLAENRSRTVKEYLVNYGIDASRLEYTSYGRERLAFPNCGGDDECHSKNRRVEWKLLAQ